MKATNNDTVLFSKQTSDALAVITGQKDETPPAEKIIKLKSMHTALQKCCRQSTENK